MLHCRMPITAKKCPGRSLLRISRRLRMRARTGTDRSLYGVVKLASRPYLRVMKLDLSDEQAVLLERELTAIIENDRYFLIGQLRGRNKLKTGSRLLVPRFPEIKFILSCCGVL